VRIPVTWSNLTDENHIIHPDLLDRVQQIVDWVIGNGMYAIVNMHHDDFYHRIPANGGVNIEAGVRQYTAIWEQISERFKDYGDYLILESQNEEGSSTAVR
jgi:endoglucanase